MKPPTEHDHERWEFTGFVAGVQPKSVDGVVVIIRFSSTQTKSVVVKFDEESELDKLKAIPAGARVRVSGVATVRSYWRKATDSNMCQMVCISSEVNVIL